MQFWWFNWVNNDLSRRQFEGEGAQLMAKIDAFAPDSLLMFEKIFLSAPVKPHNVIQFITVCETRLSLAIDTQYTSTLTMHSPAPWELNCCPNICYRVGCEEFWVLKANCTCWFAGMTNFSQFWFKVVFSGSELSEFQWTFPAVSADFVMLVI